MKKASKQNLARFLGLICNGFCRQKSGLLRTYRICPTKTTKFLIIYDQIRYFLNFHSFQKQISSIHYIQNSIDMNKNEIARIDSGINKMRCRLECNKYSLKAAIDQLEMEKNELQGENPNSLFDEKQN
ncbi:unnamed protein product [Adineta ricciae]|uniref:Uncharacterized protein n=1 Tax=Adineta ricciae TaxID=249248 RepID=A0A815QZP9_ADIRI|nr:unnamed protein product [Adineta ricciae]